MPVELFLLDCFFLYYKIEAEIEAMMEEILFYIDTILNTLSDKFYVVIKIGNYMRHFYPKDTAIRMHCKNYNELLRRIVDEIYDPQIAHHMLQSINGVMGSINSRYKTASGKNYTILPKYAMKLIHTTRSFLSVIFFKNIYREKFQGSLQTGDSFYSYTKDKNPLLVTCKPLI